MAGLFITLEGTEGSGKSTVMRLLSRRLSKAGIKVVKTREPGGPKLAEKIRKVILDNSMNERTELFLYEASRAEHVEKTIIPSKKAGKVVLCDRFADSTMAYQAYARGLPWKKARELNHFATGGLYPDLTVFLDYDPAKGLKRATVQTRFEKEGLKFQQKVRKGFLKSMKEKKQPWLHIKVTDQTPDMLVDQVISRIKRKLPKKVQGKL